MKNKKKPNIPDYKAIKTGWARLDEKTQKKLSAMGIHARTPGRLITAKGSIDGTLSAFGTVWGKIGMTGDKAQKAMGFTPKEGAKGVLLSRRRYVDKNGKVKSGIFATSLMSFSGIPTKGVKCRQERMRVIGKILSNHLRDIIYPIWDPLVKNRNKFPWDGCRYFASVNNINVGTSLNWKKLQISAGPVSLPKCICANRYDVEKKEIHISIPRTVGRIPITINQMGIGIFDRITEDFLHISPEWLNQEIEQKLKASGLTTEHLRRLPKNSVIEPLRFQWELKNIRPLEEKKMPRNQPDDKSEGPKKRKIRWTKIPPEPPPDKSRHKPIILPNSGMSICANLSRWMRREHLRFYIYNYYKRISPVTKKPEYSPSLCRRMETFLPGETKDTIDGEHGISIIIEIIEYDTKEHILTR
ncbi:MAG: hypothetical protein WC614_02240 [bacterium]